MNLHGIKNNIVRDYTETEMEGKFLVGDHLKVLILNLERSLNITKMSTRLMCIMIAQNLFLPARFLNWIHAILKKVNGCQHRNVISFEQDVIEVIGKNCYIPSSGFFF